MSFRRSLIRRCGGFSLMEMLIVAAILPVIFFTVFANLSSGLRTWKAFNRPVSEEETVIFLNHARSDFSNVFVYTPQPFTGDGVQVSFMAPLLSGPKELAGDRAIGRVTYRYDSSQKAIVRQEANMSELYQERGAPARVVLNGVTALRIEYLSFQPAESAYLWSEVWQPAKRPLPAAVRLTIDRDAADDMVKTFLVPGGN